MAQRRGSGLTPLGGSHAGSPTVDRRRQVIAMAWIGGLLLAVLLLWLFVALAGGDEGASDRAPMAARTGSGEPPGDTYTDLDVAPDEGTAGDPSPAPEDAEGEPGDEEPTNDAEEDEATTTIDFDGICTVEIPEDEADPSARPWDFEECGYAPVSVAPAAEEWIVVRASLAGADFDATGADDRASGMDADGVLWSSHYPSLNPDIWVVYDGPFSDGETATAAAEAVGAGAYPRALTVDDDDRYCIASDDCVGERAD